jgi:hydroxymethylglutaryl-CoA reductase
MGIATNFRINGRDLLIPMAVEESSVVAAASHGAKLARSKGGFRTSSTAPVGTGQIQIYPHKKQDFDAILEKHKAQLIALANEGHERLLSRGGGAQNLSWRYFSTMESLVLYLDVDTRDAMGANMINTLCERLAKRLIEIIPGEMGLRILTNLTDKRLARATCTVAKEALKNSEFSGEEVVERIEKAYLFAAHDVYRATTHNKGVMNGIDAVAIATGQDWRAIEAGAHAWAARNGSYGPLARWWVDEAGALVGELDAPMAVGTVGGPIRLHPTVKLLLSVSSRVTWVTASLQPVS